MTSVFRRTCIILVLLMAGVVCVYWSTAHAAGFVALEEYKGSTLEGVYNVASGPGSLAKFFTELFKVALSVGAMIAVLRLVYAGYMYMGSDLWSSKGKAREIISSTVLGLFLLLAIWLILFQINPQILNLKITFPKTAAPAGGL